MRGGNLYYSLRARRKNAGDGGRVDRRGANFWASDFPHERPWEEFSGDIDTLIDRKDLPESLTAEDFFDNPRRLYNLKLMEGSVQGQVQSRSDPTLNIELLNLERDSYGEPMRILITGAGLIGTHTAKELSSGAMKSRFSISRRSRIIFAT